MRATESLKKFINNIIEEKTELYRDRSQEKLPVRSPTDLMAAIGNSMKQQIDNRRRRNAVSALAPADSVSFHPPNMNAAVRAGV